MDGEKKAEIFMSSFSRETSADVLGWSETDLFWGRDEESGFGFLIYVPRAVRLWRG